MKKPDGSIDLIGVGLQVFGEITSIVADNLPTKAERKVNVGLRRLKHRFKNVKVETYVRANFDECTEDRQLGIINYYKEQLNRE